VTGIDSETTDGCGELLIESEGSRQVILELGDPTLVEFKVAFDSSNHKLSMICFNYLISKRIASRASGVSGEG
jgi:hypothetical protein